MKITHVQSQIVRLPADDLDVPQRPGLGLAFDRTVLKRYGVTP